MSLTLESSDSSRLGDTTSVINTWWGTQTYDTSIVTNVGEQSYQGFYAFTTGKACTITATLQRVEFADLSVFKLSLL